MNTLQENILIKFMVLGGYQVNTYLIGCPKTKKAIIIDPGGEPGKILRMIKEEGVAPVYILNTHGHADHVVANKELSKFFSIPVCMHEADDRYFARPDIRHLIERELGLPAPEAVDMRLSDGQIIEVGDLRIQVIHTPGHSPGSACFYVNGNLFTGDTLFVGDVGRTDLTGGSLDTLLDSLRKIIRLPAETIVRPGHDYGETPTSILAREMRENPYITDFILSE